MRRSSVVYAELVQDLANALAQLQHDSQEMNVKCDALESTVAQLKEQALTFVEPRARGGMYTIDPNVPAISNPDTSLAIIRERLSRALPDFDRALSTFNTRRVWLAQFVSER